MQTPKRKAGKYTHLKPDPYLTQEKFNELKNKLDKMKKKRPFLAREVKRLASDGDFSENAAYQMAKGSLRGLNNKILEIEDHLKRAIIIQKQTDNVVQIGSTVKVEINNKIKEFKILGPTETNPDLGIISHKSPIGSALLEKRKGDVFFLTINNKEIKYKIIEIQ